MDRIQANGHPFRTASAMKSSPRAFPKLLVVTEFPPQAGGGGGALISQMLAGYPAESISWWSCRPPPEPRQCPSLARHYQFPLPNKLYPQIRWNALKAWLLEKFWVPLATAHLKRTVARAAPDQIWFLLHAWSIPPIHRAGLVQTHRCHVSIWDYQDGGQFMRHFGSKRARRFAALAESLYRQATTCDSVSRPMWEDLAHRTGRRDAIIVHSGLEPEQIRAIMLDAVPPAPEIRIAYAGTIIVRDTFELFVRAAEAIRKKLARPLQLEFFGGGTQQGERWFNGEWMREHNRLDEAGFFQALRQCTWGLTLMDVTDNNPRYNRFSFPNKFGTCLAAGLPLLVLAHRESSVAKVAQAYQLGFFSDLQDPAALSERLLVALAESNPRQRFRSEILRCAREEFDATKIRRRLWDCFGVT
jgi:glycosyltransferase involved in cell wall biosynthesis